MTLRQAIAAAASRLAANHHLRDHATRDAELLLLDTASLTRATLLAHPDRELTPDQTIRYEAAIARRLNLEPIQYITGQQEFYGLTLHVTPAVLIPRPETEHLVEAVLARLPHNQPQSLIDIGTGSGAIAIALAAHLPLATITAIDISPQALEIASRNAVKHHISHRIRFLQSDLLSALDTNERFDAIVSNPPYIPITDRDSLHPQVREHEPSTALFAGPLGLDIYRRLISQAQTALKPNGLLAMELGHGQRDALDSLLANWLDVTFLNDLQQIPRVVLARKSTP